MPASQKWREVVRLLSSQEFCVAQIANGVERSCDRALPRALEDPCFVEALWLLIKIPQAARASDFRHELKSLGITVPEDPTLADLLAGLDAALERLRIRSGRATTDFTVMARDAAVSTLHELVEERGPRLWAATGKDDRASLASLMSTERFGELAQRFFTRFLEGHLRYFLDRQVDQHIPSGRIGGVGDKHAFERAVARHCRETTLIMRAYAKEWLGKNQFHLQKQVSREDVTKFAAYAFEKIRDELAMRGGQQ